MMTRTFMANASEVREGDILDGTLEVDSISHGPLEGQLRFRNYDETHVAFRHRNDSVVIRRKV